jgi:hypothetical protein
LNNFDSSTEQHRTGTDLLSDHSTEPPSSTEQHRRIGTELLSDHSTESPAQGRRTRLVNKATLLKSPTGKLIDAIETATGCD